MNFKELPDKVRKLFQDWNSNASFLPDEIISPIETKNFRFKIKSNTDLYKTGKLERELLEHGYIIVSFRQLSSMSNLRYALITLRYDDRYNLNKKEDTWPKRKITRQRSGWVMI